MTEPSPENRFDQPAPASGSAGVPEERPIAVAEDQPVAAPSAVEAAGSAAGKVPAAVEPDDRDRDRPIRIGAWLLIVGSLALASVFVAVPAHTYELDFRRRVIADVRRIDFFELWRIQTRNLPSEQNELLLQAFFVACGIVFLLGSAYLIWLAIVDIRPVTRTPPQGEASPVAAVGDGPSS